MSTLVQLLGDLQTVLIHVIQIQRNQVYKAHCIDLSLGIFRQIKSSMPLINLKIARPRECIICLIEF